MARTEKEVNQSSTPQYKQNPQGKHFRTVSAGIERIFLQATKLLLTFTAKRNHQRLLRLSDAL